MAKPDLRKLLKEGLTGKEAARLIIADSVEVDQGRPGVLCQRDIHAIREGLQGREATEYNRWIRAYQLVDYTLKEAHIAALEASNFLWLQLETLKAVRLEDQIRHVLMSSPAIVTQSQYEELKARQKEQRLAGHHRLADLLYNVLTGRSLLPEDERYGFEEWDPLLHHPWDGGRGSQYWDGTLEELQTDHQEAWRQALQAIIQPVQAGQLHPVQLSRAAQRKLQALEAEAQKHREMTGALMEQQQKLGLWDPQADNFWDGHIGKEKRIIQKAYEGGLVKYDQARTLQALEALRDGRLPRPARDALLDASYCSARELYEAGLEPEADLPLDQYLPDWDDSPARPEGMMQSSRVAIIVDPEPSDLDERGWYQDQGAAVLSEISGYQGRKALWEKRGLALGLGLATTRKAITAKIKVYLAIQGVVEAISQALGVELGEDFSEWQRGLEVAVEFYNLYAAPVETESGRTLEPAYYLGVPKTSPIKLGKLKPTARSVQYYRDRMAMALGEDWWSLPGHLEGLEYEPPEEQSLAEELLTEIIKEREKDAGKAREGLDGQE